MQGFRVQGVGSWVSRCERGTRTAWQLAKIGVEPRDRADGACRERAEDESFREATPTGRLTASSRCDSVSIADARAINRNRAKSAGRNRPNPSATFAGTACGRCPQLIAIESRSASKQDFDVSAKTSADSWAAKPPGHEFVEPPRPHTIPDSNRGAKIDLRDPGPARSEERRPAGAAPLFETPEPASSSNPEPAP